MNRLSIRATLLLVSLVYAALIIAIGGLTAALFLGSQAYHAIEQRRLTSMELAHELKQSSDDLTRFARSYAVTGDPVYERYFRTIVAIRDGKRPHPSNHSPSYWDHVTAGKARLDQGGDRYSIEQRMLQLGLSERERALLIEAKRESDELIDLEETAFHAVKGLFRDPAGRFTIEGEPDLETARNLLHGETYHEAKGRIMGPIDRFLTLLERRTGRELEQIRGQNHLILVATSITVLFLLGFTVYVFTLLKRRVTAPLSQLETAAHGIREGDYSRQVALHRDDEIGALAAAFNAMADSIAGTHDELERRVRERTADLEQANRDLEAFSYEVSHNLRAPLRAIDGFTAILQEEHARKLDRESRHLFEVIGDNAREMGRLIDAILALAQARRMQLEHAEVDMQDLVEQIWRELVEKEPPRNIRFQCEPLQAVRCDQRAIRQVWLNLLANALKFTRGRDPALIEISGQSDAQQVRYRIRDNGAGFKQEYADQLFGPFRRLHGTDEFEGTGMGLSVVHRLLQKHGGDISGHGIPDGGATFEFTLPRKGKDN